MLKVNRRRKVICLIKFKGFIVMWNREMLFAGTGVKNLTSQY